MSQYTIVQFFVSISQKDVENIINNALFCMNQNIEYTILDYSSDDVLIENMSMIQKQLPNIKYIKKKFQSKKQMIMEALLFSKNQEVLILKSEDKLSTDMDKFLKLTKNDLKKIDGLKFENFRLNNLISLLNQKDFFSLIKFKIKEFLGIL